VEEAIQLAKGQVGLDEDEVRHWKGWYRHSTLALFALAFLTVVKVTGQKGGPHSRARSSAPPSPDGSRRAQVALAARVAGSNDAGRSAVLVTLAQATSGQGQTLP